MVWNKIIQDNMVRAELVADQNREGRQGSGSDQYRLKVLVLVEIAQA